MIVLAQSLLDTADPTHQGIAWGGFVVGILIAALILIPALATAAWYLYRKLKPALGDLTSTVKGIAAQPSPQPQAYADAVAMAISPMADTLQKVIDEYRDLRADDRAKATELESLHSAITALKSEIAEVRQKAQVDLAKQDDQLSCQRKTIDELSTRINTLQATIDNQKTELDQKNATIKEQAEQLKDLEALKAQVNELTAEVQRLKAQLGMQEKLQLELKAAQDALAKKDEQIAALVAERDALKKERDALALRVAGQALTIANELSKAGIESDARAENSGEAKA